ncbi:hypothetical protein [Flindersiella endophytica]
MADDDCGTDPHGPHRFTREDGSTAYCPGFGALSADASELTRFVEQRGEEPNITYIIPRTR